MKIYKNEEGVFKISDNGVFLLKIAEPEKEKPPNDKPPNDKPPNDKPPNDKPPNDKPENIKINDPKFIYIKNDSIDLISNQNPSFFKYLEKVHVRRSSRIKAKAKSIFDDYTQYRLNSKYDIKGEKNDCLLFSERISLSQPDYNKKRAVFSVKTGNKFRKFGVTDKQNMEIVRYVKNHVSKKDITYNVLVDPEINNSYAMVPNNLPINEDMCPYHVATVIFKDGKTNITIEADAGITNTNKAVFDMYSTSIFRFSFFRSHLPTYIQGKKTNGKHEILLPTVLKLQNKYKELPKKDTKKTDDQKLLRRSSRLNNDVIPNEEDKKNPGPIKEPSPIPIKELDIVIQTPNDLKKKSRKNKKSKSTKPKSKKQWFRGR